MKTAPIPKSIKLNPSEWDVLSAIATDRGTTRHRIMADAVRSIIQNQNPDAAQISSLGV